MMGTPREVLDGARAISKQIKTSFTQDKGCLIGRFGTIEFDVLNWHAKYGSPAPAAKTEILERNAGVFPADPASVQRWCDCVKGAMTAADVLAVGWHAPMVLGEQELLAAWGWRGTKVPLRSLEPYYVAEEERWTRLLHNQKIAVVTSFARTASQQVAKGVWPAALGTMWPVGAEWKWIQTGYPPSVALGRAGWEDSPADWSEAVDGVVRQVLESGARVVIIGCGGLGMIIGGRLKAAGKICIVMGGATQVLFGIKGGRWASHPVISNFWNAEWVWPAADETPMAGGAIENGCYWRSGSAPK